MFVKKDFYTLKKLHTEINIERGHCNGQTNVHYEKNMPYNCLIYEYEEVLLGKKKCIPTEYFESTSVDENHKNVCTIYRFAFENLLRWTPEDIKNYISTDILKQLKLDTILRYFNCPPEIEIETDLFYIAQMLYPTKIQFDFKKTCICMFKKVLNNEKQKLPKGFFTKTEGKIRGNICLQYVLDNELFFENIEEMYAFFASTAAFKVLKQYRLNSMLTSYYATPLDYLHNALSENQRNDFLYYYYKTKLEITQLIREKEKKSQ